MSDHEKAAVGFLALVRAASSQAAELEATLEPWKASREIEVVQSARIELARCEARALSLLERRRGGQHGAAPA